MPIIGGFVQTVPAQATVQTSILPSPLLELTRTAGSG